MVNIMTECIMVDCKAIYQGPLMYSKFIAPSALQGGYANSLSGSRKRIRDKKLTWPTAPCFRLDTRRGHTYNKG